MRALLIVCPLVFLGAMIDSIAGGGGLINLPAYLLAGLPPHVAAGTNKLSSTIFTTVSVARFGRSGSIHLPAVAAAGSCALVGSALGARLALFLSEQFLQILLIVCLPLLALFLLTRKGGEEMVRPQLPLGRLLPICAASGLIIGAYDGFFGPGAGTFYILCLTYFGRLELRTAMGSAKVINLASNLAALLTLGSFGKVSFTIGLPAAACGVVGSYIGSGLALKKGARVFRPVLFIVFALLLVTVAWDFFSP